MTTWHLSSNFANWITFRLMKPCPNNVTSAKPRPWLKLWPLGWKFPLQHGLAHNGFFSIHLSKVVLPGMFVSHIVSDKKETGKNNLTSCCMTKPTKWPVHPAKIWISLGIHPVWSRVFVVCMKKHWALKYLLSGPGAVARSEASSLGMQAAPSLIPTSGTFFRGDLVMKTFLRPFSLFRWFKKSSGQLLAKECALSTGKLSRRLAQEQCG